MKKVIWKRVLAMLLVAVLVMSSGVYSTSINVNAASKKVLKIAMSVNKATIYKGMKTDLGVIITPKSAKATIKWKSSNRKIATVSSKGVVKGIKKGTATITATVKGTKIKTTCKIKVKKPTLIKSIKVSSSNITMKVGESIKANVTISPRNASIKKLKYKSSNTNIVSVSTHGIIQAKGKGTATITIAVTDGSNVKTTMKVEVHEVAATPSPALPAPTSPATPVPVVSPVVATSLNATIGSTKLMVGQTTQISASVLPSNVTNKEMKYTSSDTYAATVDSNGVVTALAQGFTTIKVETVDGSNLVKTFDLVIDFNRVGDPNKPRAIVMTDGEVDDMDSLIRMLLYSNEIDIAGIVQTGCTLRWKGSEDAPYETGKYPYRWPGTEWKHEIVDAYGEVYKNLRVHDSRYPTPNYLKSITVNGNIDYVNDMSKPSDGSNLIKAAILDIAFERDSRPLSLEAWGGPVTAARALKEIEDEYKDTNQWSTIYKNICNKVTLNVCGFQDNTYDRYIALVYPDMKAVNIGFGVFAYSTANQGTPAMQERVSGDWHAKNIEFGHGALLDKYITQGDGTYLEGEVWGSQFGANEELLNNPGVFGGSKERYHFISEGDTPTYLHLIDTGLRSREGDNFGGWAGRYTKTTAANSSGVTLPKRYSSARDYVTTPRSKEGITSAVENAQIRWTEQLQNDFAARADWCIASNYSDANHKPDIKITEGLNITAVQGQRITLNAKTSDPDGDKVSVNWWHYYEAGKEINGSATNTTLVINGSEKNAQNTNKAVFTIPTDAQEGDTFHIIAMATDDGAHNMAYNQRIIITVGKAKDYAMKIALTPGVVGNNNTLLSNAGGEMKQCWIEFTPAMPGLNVTWTSSDETILTIKGTANTTAASMTPKANGKVTITATANDGSGKTATAEITVKMVQSSVSLAVPAGMKASALPMESPITLTTAATGLKWTSSNPSVATVVNGVVTSLKLGSTIITASTTDGGGAFNTIKLTFITPIAVSDISFDNQTVNLTVGGNQTLNAIIAPTNATNTALIWSSSDESVATVDANGKVTAIGVGSSNIKATAKDGSGVYKTVNITVGPTV